MDIDVIIEDIFSKSYLKYEIRLIEVLKNQVTILEIDIEGVTRLFDVDSSGSLCYVDTDDFQAECFGNIYEEGSKIAWLLSEFF